MDLYPPPQWPIDSTGIAPMQIPPSSEFFFQYPDSQLLHNINFYPTLQFPVDLPPIDEDPPMIDTSIQVYTPVQCEIPKLTKQLTEEEGYYVLTCVAALREEPDTIESSELFLETLFTQAPESLIFKIREYLNATQ